jgi:hypothetical protein
MRRLLLPAALGLLAACAAPRPLPEQLPASPQGPSAAHVFGARQFKLLRVPNPDLEAALDGALMAAYDEAVRNNSGDRPFEIGFTYSLAPKGASYPFSEVEVSCIMQERYFRRGGKLCGDFFSALDAQFKDLVEKYRK